MDKDRIITDAAAVWEAEVLPTLRRYIEVPAQSKDFDPDWKKNGHIAKVLEMARSWVSDHAPSGTIVEIVEREDRTPVLFIEIPATDTSNETVLLYAHLDKQPPCVGWDASRGLEPWKAVDVHDERGHLLFGRGGADDGYGVFAAITAIGCLENQAIPHARCVLLIETGEESGSPDLPFYVDLLKARIGTPTLIVALDSGCGDFGRLWITPSLRGIVGGVLTVEVLTEGVHSGDATGVVPDPFRLGWELISRVQNPATGYVLLPELQAEVPHAVRLQAGAVASILGTYCVNRFPWVDEARPDNTSDAWLARRILGRTWHPGLSVVGTDMPSLRGGNVRLPRVSFKLSIRIPPTIDANVAARAVEKAIEDAKGNLSHPAKVTFSAEGHASWLAPKEAPWFTEAVDQASTDVFGHPAVRMGEGGSIPFMGQLGHAFPEAQFLVTGVLGPQSNAHGPNEFLHVGFAKGLTASVALVLASHSRHFSA